MYTIHKSLKLQIIMLIMISLTSFHISPLTNKPNQKTLSKLDNDLINAICKEDLRGTAQLLEEGANIQVKDGYNETPLSNAARTGNMDLVTYLIDRGADTSDVSILPKAASSKSLAMVKLFVEKYKNNINAENIFGVTALRNAARVGSIEIADYLLDHGARLSDDIINNDPKIDKKSALHIIQKQDKNKAKNKIIDRLKQTDEKIRETIKTQVQKPLISPKPQVKKQQLAPAQQSDSSSIPQAPELPKHLQYDAQGNPLGKAVQEQQQPQKTKEQSTPAQQPAPIKSSDSKTELIKQIQQGTSLKKVVATQEQPKSSDSKTELIKQIQQGASLKKVVLTPEQQSAQKKKSSSSNPLMDSLSAAIDARRKSIEGVDKSKEEADDEVWD